MKNIKIYIAALFFLLVTGRCKEINPFEGVDLVVSGGAVNSPVLLQFTDANPGSSTQPDKVTVKITGDKAAAILDDAGGKNYKVAGNVLTLILAKEVTASPSAPVTFTIEVAAPGYLTTSQTFSLTGSDPARFVVPMVHVKNPPEGVTAVQATVPVSSGKITLLDNGTEVGSVGFKSDTKVMDAAGNTISAANVSAEVLMFDTEEIQSLAAFPGGLTPASVQLKSGESRSVRFVTAGIAAINMTAGGKEVKKFSKPVEVSMAIDPHVKNPQTGEAIKEGSSIPVWSFETATGQWKEEGEAVVYKNEKGQLAGRFEISHLSYWSINYAVLANNRCSNQYAVFKVSSNVEADLGNYTGFLFDAQGNFMGSGYGNFNVANGNQTNIIQGNGNLNAGDKLRLEVREKVSGKTVAQTTFDACTEVIPVNITIPDPVKTVAVDIDLAAICKGENLRLKPSGWFGLYNPATLSYTNVYLQDGKARIYVVEGVEYSLNAFYEGKIYSGKVTFKRDGSVVIADGNGLAGTTGYDAGSDLITYKAEYIIANCK